MSAPYDRASLRALFEAGRTYSEIAAELGITKNVVAGAIYRMRACGEIEWPHRPPPCPTMLQRLDALQATFERRLAEIDDQRQQAALRRQLREARR